MVKVVTVDENLQNFDTDYCGLFQIYVLSLGVTTPLLTPVMGIS